MASRRLGGSDGSSSLMERLNPATTEKGGRTGDMVDALLAKLGAPGKIASKASLGSRVVERMRSDDEPPEESDEEPEDEVADEADEGDEGDEGDEEGTEEDEPRAEAADEGEAAEDEEPDEPREDEELDESREDEEPDPYLEDEPEHAYSDVLERYRRPPNAYTGAPD